MNIRTFSGKSMEDALKAARRELGQNVIVLESKYVMQKGLLKNTPAIELAVTTDVPQTHAVNGNPSGAYDHNGNQTSFNPILNEMQRQIDNSPVLTPSDKLIDEISQLREELQDMARRFRKIISPEFPEPFSFVFEKLTGKGVLDDHARSLVRRAFLHLDGDISIEESDVLALVHREIDNLFKETEKILPIKPIGQKVIALIGGTGVGKTTTIMKLASNPDFYGKMNVGIISIDTYRAGAMAPLQAFEKIAGISVHEARSVEEAREKLLKLKDKDVVLIDTPGRSLYYENYAKELNQYLTVLSPTRTLLVLASNTDIDDLFLTTGLAIIQKPTGLVITKFDETDNPGKTLSVMKEINVPIQVICDGQSVPNNICLGTTDNLWTKIFNGKY